MKFNFLHIIVFVAIILFGFSFSSKKFSDPNKEKLLIEVVKYVVEKGHYSALDIDDKISEKIYNTYIEQLDAQKRFFLQSDIRQFEKYKFRLDDQIKDQDLTFFNLVYETSRERINEVKTYYEEIMSNSFDFSSNENINLEIDTQLTFMIGVSATFTSIAAIFLEQKIYNEEEIQLTSLSYSRRSNLSAKLNQMSEAQIISK